MSDPYEKEARAIETAVFVQEGDLYQMVLGVQHAAHRAGREEVRKEITDWLDRCRGVSAWDGKWDSVDTLRNLAGFLRDPGFEPAPPSPRASEEGEA